MVAASLGAIGPAERRRAIERLRRWPEDSKSETAVSTPFRSRAVELDPWLELPPETHVAQAGEGSFDCATASLREPVAPLRMTGLFFSNSLTNWRIFWA